MTLRLVRTVAGITLGLYVLAPGAVHAAWPAVIMIYGGSLQQPEFVGPRAAAGVEAGLPDYRFLYGGSTDRLEKKLAGRPFFSLAMYWSGDLWAKADADPAVMKGLKPEAANQHGRLYPPVGSEPAVVIATPYMAGSACGRGDDGPRIGGLIQRPLPVDVKDLPCGWTLGADELKILAALGIPGV